jgi:biopolymer transport protein ExbB
MIRSILFATLLTAATAQAGELSTLERAYLKELAFLKAQKAEMEKRAKESEQETTRILAAAKTQVDELGTRVLALKREADLTEEALRDTAPASKEKIDAVYDTAFRANEAAALEGDAEIRLPTDRAPTEDEIEQALTASFTAVSKQIVAGQKISAANGVFFGLDGKVIEGRIIRVGNAVSYGVSPAASGMLVPTGDGQLKLAGVAQPATNMGKKHGIVETLMGLPIFEAEWVLYLLILMSIVSVGVMVERSLFFRKHAVDIEAVRAKLKGMLKQNDFHAATEYLAQFDSLETNVVLSGLREHHAGADSVEDLLRGAEAKERLRYNKWLSFLATVGSNAPFIGLFGTVLGIIRAFGDLASEGAGGSVMGGISEALIATAVGLLVAIPAVVAYNAFMGRVKTVLANSELLSRTLLSSLKANVG